MWPYCLNDIQNFVIQRNNIMVSLKNYSHTITAGVFVALMIQSTAVLAQLEEVIVTAERREASIQDVPLAVSAYNEESLEMLQIDDTLGLINAVPNLFGGNNVALGTANMYYLRAQGNDETIATFDPAVGTYVDDVYVTRQNANNYMLFDVERIEVLRGPQGTLFGRNTTGGAVNVIMKKPGEEYSGYAEVGYGRYSEYMARASIDMPFSDTVHTKLSAYVIKDDGWLHNTVDGNTYNDKNNKGFRAALRFMPSDALTWDISIDLIESHDSYIWSEIVGSKRYSSSVLPAGLPPIPGWAQKSDDYGNEAESLSVISDLGWDMAGGYTNLIIGYRDLNHDFLANFPGEAPPFPFSEDFFWIDNVGDHEMLTAELKWNAELLDDRLNLVTGIFYLDEDNTTDFADYLLGFLRLADRVLENSTDSWALYAQGDIAVGENGTLTIGLRYTDEQKKIGLSDNTGGNLTTAGLMAAGIPLKLTETKFTPRIAYAHQFQENVMGYASATSGFKSGGWNARCTAPEGCEDFGPETIWSYELGMRAEWLDGRLRTNAQFFYSDLKDLQTTAATPSGLFLTTNAGGLNVPGFELELTALPKDNWEIFLALGLQNPKLVDLPEGCTVPNFSYATYDRECNTATTKRAPEETVTLGTAFQIPIPAFNARLQPTASVRYIGKNVVGTSNQGVNDSVFVANAGLSLIGDQNVWSATIECRNCFDEEYITSYLFTDYWTPPMTWQARIRFNW
jgi:iron complex outermembrane receptor protein